MKLKDERVKSTNEVLSGMKILKLYGWEQAFIDKINVIRNKELINLKSINALYSFIITLFNVAPFLVSFIAFAIYVLVSDENVLTAQRTFYSLSLFQIIRFPLVMLPNLVTMLIMVSPGKAIATVTTN